MGDNRKAKSLSISRLATKHRRELSNLPRAVTGHDGGWFRLSRMTSAEGRTEVRRRELREVGMGRGNVCAEQQLDWPGNSSEVSRAETARSVRVATTAMRKPGPCWVVRREGEVNKIFGGKRTYHQTNRKSIHTLVHSNQSLTLIF